MSEFVVEFGREGEPPAADGRLNAPAFHRNHAAIWSVLSPILEGQTGDALELGSGTGQHAVEFARRSPHLTWWPSDIAPAHLASIAAWREHAESGNLRPPQRIDLLDPAWTWHDGEQYGRPLTAIMCNNVLHISPWEASQNLIAGAARLLRKDGHLFVYGPFMRDGTHTAESNARFDAALRMQNPAWGVRDLHELEELGHKAGLVLTKTAAMPANNLTLVFARNDEHN